jgi:hypothetical protein
MTPTLLMKGVGTTMVTLSPSIHVTTAMRSLIRGPTATSQGQGTTPTTSPCATGVMRTPSVQVSTFMLAAGHSWMQNSIAL